MLGKTTVKTVSSNRGSSAQVRASELFGSSSTQEGGSIGETRRQLLLPEEVKELGDKLVLAFLRGERPIMCQRLDYRDRVEWQGLWDENPLHQRRMAAKKPWWRRFIRNEQRYLLAALAALAA